MMDGKLIDSNSGNDGSNREHLLSFQNHAAVAFRRYLEGTVRAWTRLRRFGTDRDGHGSDGGAGRDRGVRGIRLFRRTGRDRHDGSEGVDMIRLELGDLDAKVFVLARTPLLASMGRWVILSNSSSAFRNPAKKTGNAKMLTATCTGRRRVRRRVANTPLRIPRCVLVGDEERVMMKTPAANLVSALRAWSSTMTSEATPSSPRCSSWSPRSSSEISCNQLSNTSYRYVRPRNGRNAQDESHHVRYPSGLRSAIPPLLIAHRK